MPSDHPVASSPIGRLSRRRLIAASALALATPLGLLSGQRSAAADSGDDAYARAFDQALAADPNVRRHLETGRELLYRPRQLLVANADTQRVLTKLHTFGHQVTVGGGFAGVSRLWFSRETDVPAVVTKLRNPREWPNQQVPAVQPHHVLLGYGNIMGNPGSPPRVAAPLPPPDPGRAGEGAGVTVGICDTGIWRLAGGRHPQWLGGSYLPQSDDEDPLYLSGDALALQGGHGTFVAGVVRQAAPGVRLDPEQALQHTGIGDEESLVGALSRLESGVALVNLSLGCFTQDDVPPLPLVNALDALPSRTAVVAAAGNAGTGRPSWPAALPDVLAVAALAADGAGGPVPAPYSGYGPWVDACAVGERVSTYVDGRLLLSGQPTRYFTGFAGWAGTSFATAHVTGWLARWMSATGQDGEAARLALVANPRWHANYGVLVG